MKGFILALSFIFLLSPICSETLSPDYQQSICFTGSAKIEQVSDTWGFAGIAEPVPHEYKWRHYISFKTPENTFVTNAKLKVYYYNSQQKGNSSSLELHHFPAWQKCTLPGSLEICYSTLNTAGIKILNSSFIGDKDSFGFYEQEITEQWNTGNSSVSFMLKQALEVSDIYNFHRYNLDVNNVFIEYTADEAPEILSVSAEPVKMQNRNTISFSSEVHDSTPGAGIKRKFCSDINCTGIYCETEGNSCSAFIDSEKSSETFYAVACDSYGACSPGFESVFYVNHAPVMNSSFSPEASHNSSFVVSWGSAYDADNDSLFYAVWFNSSYYLSYENSFFMEGCGYNKNCTINVSVCDLMSCSDNVSFSVFVFDSPVTVRSFEVSPEYSSGPSNASIVLECHDIDSEQDIKGCYIETDEGKINSCTAQAELKTGGNIFRGCCTDFLGNTGCSEYKTSVRLDPVHSIKEQENISAGFGGSYDAYFSEQIMLNNSLSEKQWLGNISCAEGDWVSYLGNKLRPPVQYSVAVPAFSVLNASCSYIFENALFVSNCEKTYFEDCDAGESGICMEYCPVTLKNNIGAGLSFDMLNKSLIIAPNETKTENFFFNSTGSILFRQSGFFSENSSFEEQTLCSNISLLNTLNHPVFADFFPESPEGNSTFNDIEIEKSLNLTLCWTGDWIHENSSSMLLNSTMNISYKEQLISYNYSLFVKNTADADFPEISVMRNSTAFFSSVYHYSAPKITNESKTVSAEVYEYAWNLSVPNEQSELAVLFYYLNKSCLDSFEKRESLALSIGEADETGNEIRISLGRLNKGNYTLKLIYTVKNPAIIYQSTQLSSPQPAPAETQPVFTEVKNASFEAPESISMDIDSVKNISLVIQNTGNTALTNITLSVQGLNPKIYADSSFFIAPGSMESIVVELDSSDTVEKESEITVSLSGDVNMSRTIKVQIIMPEPGAEINAEPEISEELSFSENTSASVYEAVEITGSFVKEEQENKNFEIVSVVFFLSTGVLALNILTRKRRKDF